MAQLPPAATFVAQPPPAGTFVAQSPLTIMIFMDADEQRALVKQAAEGDRDALQRLIVSYHRPLRVALAREIGPQERRYLEADDVLQDAYVAAFKAIAGCRFDGPPQLYKWLERIAVNTLKNRRRALKRQKRDVGREEHGSRRPRTSYPLLFEQLSAPVGTPSRRAAQSEAVAAVLSSLARLTEDQRDVIRLRFLEEQPVAQVATQLGKTDAAVHPSGAPTKQVCRWHPGEPRMFAILTSPFAIPPPRRRR